MDVAHTLKGAIEKLADYSGESMMIYGNSSIAAYTKGELCSKKEMRTRVVTVGYLAVLSLADFCCEIGVIRL